MRPVLLVAQTSEMVRDLLGQAYGIGTPAGDEGPQIRIALAPDVPGDSARKLAGETGLDIHSFESSGTAGWAELKQGLGELITDLNPGLVLFAHTTFAREVAPALAVRLGGASVSNVTAIGDGGRDWCFTRPVMDNTRIQEVRVPKDALSVLTLSPGMAPCGGTIAKKGRSGRVIPHQLPLLQGIRRLGLGNRAGAAGEGVDQDLSRAPIVVAAGQGIGEKENLEQVKSFARAFPKAALAVSRPLVDQGWVPYKHQVGITGARVSPDLYIALGISGSSQHLAGMAGSKWVVSVNKNPMAPIFTHSDLCILGDLFEFIDGYLSEIDIEK